MQESLWVDLIDMLLKPSWASLVAHMLKNLPAMLETQVPYLGQEDPLEEGNDNMLQYSCLENPMDRGAWWAPRDEVPSVVKSQT